MDGFLKISGVLFYFGHFVIPGKKLLTERLVLIGGKKLGNIRDARLSKLRLWRWNDAGMEN
jgi:hypothetical protein